MSEKKIAVGYVFNFDCNNDVLRLKMKEEEIGGKCDGEVIELKNEPALARVSRVTKPHPESLTTWYDLEFPAVVYNSFTMRVTEPEIYKMGGKLDIPATASEFSAEIIAASDKGNHEKVCSIWTAVGLSGQSSNKILIEMHKNKAVSDAVVESARIQMAWMGKLLTTSQTYDVVDGKGFMTITDTWENHSETRRVPYEIE